ncbi:MAG: Mth938-like domain-containing protein [Pseudomonadota bacterium]
MSEIGYEGQPPIDSYGGGGFRIMDGFRAGDLMITPVAGVMDWDAAALSAVAFEAVFAEAGEIDVLLVGMGAEIAPLPAATRIAMDEAGIGVEVMSTASACRTYNVLLAEDRRVAIAARAV